MVVRQERQPIGPFLLFFLVLTFALIVLILSLREGEEVREMNNPAFTTLETCGGFCSDECVQRVYDRVRTQVSIEGNITTCLCTCNSTLHRWLFGG